MKKLFLLSLAVYLSINMTASPAFPRKTKVVQPDGNVITVTLRGDERMNYYESESGEVLLFDKDGFLKYAVLSADGKVVPGDIKAVDGEIYATARNSSTEIKEALVRQSVALKNETESKAKKLGQDPGSIKNTFPTTGKVRGLVILAQFQDIKFSKDNANEIFNDLANKEGYTGEYASGSVRDYFVAQSNDTFQPEFDVVGPITLPKKSEYYGSAFDTGSERIPQLMKDAVAIADSDCGVDFSRYDANNDGFVDFVFLIYAGHGQSQSLVEADIWPQAVDLSEDLSVPEYDGMLIGKTACTCELRGTHEENTIDGIGTFCHEFSHILGLPDIYDTAYSFYGMGNWDIMDIGEYNDESRTPSGYTAMDKYTVGWLKPEIITDETLGLSLEALSTSNKAYFIVSDKDPNEYYTLENRQPAGWDKALPGHGLLISHINYNASIWKRNVVNTSSSKYEHVQLMPADNLWNSDNQDADTYPGTGNVTSFTFTTKPALTWRSGDDATGTGVVNIREDDGVVTFDYKNTLTTAISGINAETKVTGEAFNIMGQKADLKHAASGIYIVDGKKIVIKNNH